MIAVFGSINADFCFEVERCPEAGETLASKRLSIAAGGKGANQAVAAARDGAEVVMIGAVGNDPLSTIALANLVADGVDLSHVHMFTGLRAKQVARRFLWKATGKTGSSWMRARTTA